MHARLRQPDERLRRQPAETSSSAEGRAKEANAKGGPKTALCRASYLREISYIAPVEMETTKRRPFGPGSDVGDHPEVPRRRGGSRSRSARSPQVVGDAILQPRVGHGDVVSVRGEIGAEEMAALRLRLGAPDEEVAPNFPPSVRLSARTR